MKTLVETRDAADRDKLERIAIAISNTVAPVYNAIGCSADHFILAMLLSTVTYRSAIESLMTSRKPGSREEKSERDDLVEILIRAIDRFYDKEPTL